MNHISQNGERRENEGIEPQTRKEKKKEVEADVVSWSHLFQESSALFQKPSTQRYPATCPLTGADQSESHSWSFSLTWEIKKAEGRRGDYTRHQGVVLGQNEAGKNLRHPADNFYILGGLRWGLGIHSPFTGLSSTVHPVPAVGVMTNRMALRYINSLNFHSVHYSNWNEIYLPCRIILKPYGMWEVCSCWSLMGVGSNSMAFH